jgi:hypothetical protein
MTKPKGFLCYDISKIFKKDNDICFNYIKLLSINCDYVVGEYNESTKEIKYFVYDKDNNKHITTDIDDKFIVFNILHFSKLLDEMLLKITEPVNCYAYNILFSYKTDDKTLDTYKKSNYKLIIINDNKTINEFDGIDFFIHQYSFDGKNECKQNLIKSTHGGYYEKYLKYKTKYLNLLKIKIDF